LPKAAPILQNIYTRRSVYKRDRNAYCSALHRELEVLIYNTKAAYAKECEFAMEEKGFPPIDAS